MTSLRGHGDAIYSRTGYEPGRFLGLRPHAGGGASDAPPACSADALFVGSVPGYREQTGIDSRQGIPLHPAFPQAYRYYQEIARKYQPEESSFRGLCHGDLFANNFLLADNGQIVLLDYEYAGMSDVFYDLACFSIGWGAVEKEQLLRLYFGKSNPQLLQKLFDFSVISWMWNGTWAYLKSCEVSPEQFDYIDFGHRHIDAILNVQRDHSVS